jgi:HSP20 family protein
MANIKVEKPGQKAERQSQEDQHDVRRQRSGGLARQGGQPSSLFFPVSAHEFLGSGAYEMMRRFSEEMDRAFGHIFENLGLSQRRGLGEQMAWAPAVEIFERDNNVIVRAELPGLSADDVKVEMTDEGLVIHGERKREKEEEHEGWYRSERSYGEFRRLISMPEGVNADQAKARFENGVLEITVPIPESARRRRSVPIEIGGGQASQAAGGGSSKQ